MNIHGHKLKIKEIHKELKKGERDLGEVRFNVLKKWKNYHKHKIDLLRRNKSKK